MYIQLSFVCGIYRPPAVVPIGAVLVVVLAAGCDNPDHTTLREAVC